MPKTCALPTMCHLLQRRADELGDAVAFRFIDGNGAERQQLTYAALYTASRRLGAGLRARTAPGDRVAVLLPPGLGYVIAVFACLMARVVAVPSPPPRGRRDTGRVPRLLADADVRLALVAAGDAARMQAAGSWPSKLSLLDPESGLLDASDDALLPESSWTDATADDLALLQYTSGSTREPRGVMLSHRQLMANAAGIASLNGHRSGETAVFWLPPYHDMGLMGGILQPVFAGAHTVLMAPATFLQRPLRWLQAMHDYRAVTTGAPDFAWRLCVERTTPAERSALDLSSLRVAFNGAEPIQHVTVQRFLDAFAVAQVSRTVFVPCYGLAEATLLVTGTQAGTPMRTLELPARQGFPSLAGPPTSMPTLVGCGTPPPGVEVAVVDGEQGLRLPDGHEGEIWVRGETVAAGYWGNSAESARMFGAQMAHDAPSARGWLRTGDLGVWCEGMLYVSGRDADRIVVDGRNVHPQDVEWAAAGAHPAIDPSGCVAIGVPSVDQGTRVMVLAEISRGSRARNGDIEHAVRQAVSGELGLSVQVTCFETQVLPRTTSGKRQRAMARSAWCAGALTPRDDGALPEFASFTDLGVTIPADEERARSPERVPTAELCGWAISWISEDTGQHPEQLDAAQPLTALGLDSAGVLRFQLAFETRFKCECPEVLYWESTSLYSLCEVMADGVVPSTVPPTVYSADEWSDLARWPEVTAAAARSNALRDSFFHLIEPQQDMCVVRDGRTLMHFAGYDYLGFSGDSRVRLASSAAIQQWGTSASASRLVSGERPVHRQLEAAIAELLNTDDAITFISGHATNVAVLSHLMGPGDVICCDERLHNSGWLGALHSGARVLPFAHGDAAALDRILQKERTRYRRALIAIESVYSADGDVADLASFVAVKERHGALLFVDEAHGTGVLGATGRGLAEATGIPSAAVDIWMGTLSKALASCGGFIAGARPLVNYLRTTCPAFVFSVGMPPGTAAAALAAVQLLRQEPERVETLRARAMAFRMQAAAAGLPVETSGTTATSPIIPIITGGSAGALALAAALEREGVLAAPMLPPAVPAGASRVRFFVSAAHAEFQVSAAVAALVRTYPAVVL